MNVSLRQLQLFAAIARLDSLTAAADEQAISQSAASQSLKELERQLGYDLFRKIGRTLTLTEAGQQALPKILQVLIHLDSLAFPQADFIGGKLRVSASETIASYLMPKLLAGFIANYPLVEPELSIHNSDGVIERVTSGLASIGFIEGPTSATGVSVNRWREDQLKVFCRPDAQWLKLAKVPEGEWSTMPWIVRERGSGTRAVFDQAFAQRQETPRIRLALNRQEAIKQSVRAGLGIGCLSELALVDELTTGTLVELPTVLQLKRTFAIVHLDKVALTPLVHRFTDFAQHWRP